MGESTSHCRQCPSLQHQSPTPAHFVTEQIHSISHRLFYIAMESVTLAQSAVLERARHRRYTSRKYKLWILTPTISCCCILINSASINHRSDKRFICTCACLWCFSYSKPFIIGRRGCRFFNSPLVTLAFCFRLAFLILSPLFISSIFSKYFSYIFHIHFQGLYLCEEAPTPEIPDQFKLN